MQHFAQFILLLTSIQIIQISVLFLKIGKVTCDQKHIVKECINKASIVVSGLQDYVNMCNLIFLQYSSFFPHTHLMPKTNSTKRLGGHLYPS